MSVHPRFSLLAIFIFTITLNAYSQDEKSGITLARGKKPIFSNDGLWIAAVHSVPAGELLKSTPKPDNNKEPKSGLILANTSTGDQHIYDTVQSFSFSNDSHWLLYQKYKDEDQSEKRDLTKKHWGQSECEVP